MTYWVAASHVQEVMLGLLSSPSMLPYEIIKAVVLPNQFFLHRERLKGGFCSIVNKLK